MKSLSYKIEDSVIAQVLGIQNFNNDESAVLELVKNSYDAKATICHIIFKEDSLIFADDGWGMNDDDISKSWMFVGKSSKGYSISDGNKTRVLAGSKGIGRFALARLGKSVHLISKKVGSTAIHWTTDWNSSYIDNTETPFEHGTQITIENLRERWTPKKIENLKRFLTKTYNDDSMIIKLTANEVTETLGKYLPEPILGVNCYATIDLYYKSENTTLIVEIHSREFSREAKKYCPQIENLEFHSKTINLTDDFDNSSTNEAPDPELQSLLRAIGDFSANLQFSVTHTKKDIERFLYTEAELSEKLPQGVVLYRNAFSISSMEGKKDWLCLGVRSRKSPAAATHPTGSWRVRENQLSGEVLIDKKENPLLEDLSNRQGLNENIYYDCFIRIIHRGLREFEEFRQAIIRGVNNKNKTTEKTEKKLINLLLDKPQRIYNFNRKQYDELIKEIDSTVKENKFLFYEKEELNEKYHYEVRLLNVLATMGLKASSAAHEFKNDRNNLNNPTFIKQALIDYGMWDTLCSKENTKYFFRNVPELLKKCDRVNHKISTFMNAVLANTKKSRFKKNWLNISKLIENIGQNWCCDYAQIRINLAIDDGLFYSISEDILYVIFDNLILNSVQQNDKKEINISIFAELREDLLYFKYSDDGKGLAKCYRSNPFKILEVHESSREDGHGLGMWIVNNTCISSGGKIESINGDNGFSIEFTIGNKLL